MRLVSSFLILVYIKSTFSVRPKAELVELLKNTSYDASVPPAALPVLVSIQVGLYALNEVNTRTQSFKLKFVIRLIWQDERISFIDGFYQIPRQLQRMFWFPNIVVLAALGGSNGLDHFLKGDEYVKLMHDGTIDYREMRRMMLSCPMNLRKFPFDTQFCKLEISAVGEYINEVTFQEIPFTYETKSEKQVPITGWELIKTNSFKRPWSKKFNETVLVWEFELKRLYTRYIVTYILPTTVIVFLTFVSFWIPQDIVPVRIALVLTNFLSICVILRGLSSELPKVDYITPLEVYLIASITFILVVMVEYVLVMKEACLDFCSSRGIYQIENIEMKVARNAEQISQERGQVDDEHPPIPVKVPAKAKRQTSDSTVDEYSRILLPVSYILFIVVYFLYYLNHL